VLREIEPLIAFVSRLTADGFAPVRERSSGEQLGGGVVCSASGGESEGTPACPQQITLLDTRENESLIFDATGK
jgi:hypothetical protein